METATLTWFDVSSGEGMVQLDSDKSLQYLHFTTIAGISKNNYAYPSKSDQTLLHNLKSGDPCKVTLYVNLYSSRVDTCDFDVTTIRD